MRAIPGQLEPASLAELGFDSLPADALTLLSECAYDVLEHRVGSRMLAMSPVLGDAVEEAMITGDDAYALSHLAVEFPDYEAIVSEEIANVRAALSKAS